MGASITFIKLITGAEKAAKLSGDSFARLLGVISPNIRTTIVITIVETVAPELPISLINHTVAMEERPIFTILLPTRMVESSLS